MCAEEIAHRIVKALDYEWRQIFSMNFSRLRAHVVKHKCRLMDKEIDCVGLSDGNVVLNIVG